MDLISFIGDVNLHLDRFSNLDSLFSEFQSESFKTKSSRQRFRFVNEKLITLIQEVPSPAFLLAAVIDYIDRINKSKVLKENFGLIAMWI
jgi:hypothetical protein